MRQQESGRDTISVCVPNKASSVFASDSKQKGFALVFAIFLAVSLQAAVAGNLLYMMRQTRQSQFQADKTQISWAGDSVIDRALLLFEEYISAKNQFPGVDANDLVEGDDSAATEIDGTPLTFADFLRNWYDDFQQTHESSLSAIVINETPGNPETDGIRIKQIAVAPDDPDKWRTYEIEVDLTHEGLGATVTVVQEATINNGQLFKFSVFYNDRLEIGAGPDFTLQGPIFSNESVFLMNDKGSTLTLKRSEDFADANPEDQYVLNSARSIYFYRNRAVGRNYLLDNEVYRDNVLDAYRYEFGDPSAGPNELEVSPAWGFDVGTVPDVPYEDPYYPRFHYFSSGALLANPDGTDSPPNNVIQIEAGPAGDCGSGTGCVQLVPPHPELLSGAYSHYDLQPGGTFVNMSSAIDFSFWPVPDQNPSWSETHPYTDSQIPSSEDWVMQVKDNAVFGSPSTVGDLSTFQIARRNIPVGDSETGTHVLIEPLTDIFPANGPGTPATVPDSAEVQSLKLQSKADINLYCTEGCPGASNYSPDLDSLISVSAVTFPILYDYRVGENRKALQLDISQLLTTLTDQQKQDGVIVYIHAYALDEFFSFATWNLVKLVNGSRLPEGGLTIVSNGRVFVQGEYDAGNNRGAYNTYDYGKARDCTDAEWDKPFSDPDRCLPPPAAIFSDSIVFLSSDWNSSGTEANKVDITQRTAGRDLMVNAAVATGYLPSQLKKRYSCTPDMSNCEAYAPSGALNSVNNFVCPDGLDAAGQPVDGSSTCQRDTDWNGTAETYTGASCCEYYRDMGETAEGIEGVYYINCNSAPYQRAVHPNNPYGPALYPEPEASSCKIPIFVDHRAWNNGTNIPVRSWCGVHFSRLNRTAFFGNSWICTCPGPDTTCGGTVCSGNRVCEQAGEGSEVCGDCAVSPDCQWSDQQPYINRQNNYYYLYDQNGYYSGGLENLINFQEHWGTNPAKKIVRLSGTLAAPWFAAELVAGGAPKYWRDSFTEGGVETVVYVAPVRKYDYDEDLKAIPPPGTPGVFSVKRGRWSQGSG